MLLRAFFAFLALPGVVAGIVPAVIILLDPWRADGPAIRAGIFGPAFVGAGLLGLGVVLLLCCVRDFYVAGKGTLAPWDPPRHLVIVGLYGFVRNPMYVSVLVVLCGWFFLSASKILMGYWLIVAVAFHVRVIRSEEAWLANRFPGEWFDYSRSVRRWLPRVTPWYPDRGSEH